MRFRPQGCLVFFCLRTQHHALGKIMIPCYSAGYWTELLCIYARCFARAKALATSLFQRGQSAWSGVLDGGVHFGFFIYSDVPIGEEYVGFITMHSGADGNDGLAWSREGGDFLTIDEEAVIIPPIFAGGAVETFFVSDVQV